MVNNKISIPRKVFDEIFRNGGEKAVLKQMTGDFEMGVPRGMSNAEVEDGEYLQDADGVKKAIGEKHEDGGIPVKMDNGDKVLSNHLQIGATLAKRLKEKLGIPAKAMDTYSKVLDKYTKKIGLTELTEELEEYMTQIKKQKTDVKSKTTANLNIEFLSKEIQDVQEKKASLDQQKEQLFNELFQEQESSKKQKQSSVKFEDGGIWEQIAIKYNIPPERAKELIMANQFAEGGEKKLIPAEGRYKVDLGANALSGLPKVKQSANDVAYGDVKDLTIAMQNLYQNFPDIINSDETFKKYIKISDKGKVEWKGGIDLNKKQKAVENLQNKMQDRMTNTANHVINNPEVYGSDAVDRAKMYLENETFSDKALARGIDSMFGNNTAQKSTLNMGLAVPEDYKILSDNGVYTLKQVSTDNPVFQKLSPESQKTILEAKKRIGNTNADFAFSPYKVGEEPKPAKQVSTQQTGIGNFANTPAVNKETVYGSLSTPTRAYNMPTFMPSLKTTTRFPRIEANVISPEQSLSEIDRAALSAKANLQGLTPAQQAAALSSVTANQINASSKAIQEANRYNAQAKQAAENYNAQLTTQEAHAENQNALNYEARTFTGLGNYENDLNNLMNQQFADQQQKWQYTQMMNLQNALNKDVQFTGKGFEVYSPNLGELLGTKQLENLSQTDKTKTKTKQPKGRFGGRFKKK